MGAVAAASVPRIHGGGVLERAWRSSPWLAELPQFDVGRWLGGAQGLVVVAPHPDDEVLGAGGVMAMARQAGVAVSVVSVTDGEACYPDSPLWPPAQLRTTRRDELIRAMACLDVSATAIQTLEIPDGTVAAHVDDLTAALRASVNRHTRVLTTWRHDGHPDHEATARAVERACTASGAHLLQFPVWAWHWMPPTGVAPQLPGAWRCPLSSQAARAKVQALRCFASQLDSQDQTVPPILPPHVIERFQRAYEVLLP